MAAVKPGSIFFLFVVLFLSFGSDILADNGLYFTHTPNYVLLSPDAGKVRSSEVSDIISLALGFSASKELKWSGLSSGNLFRRPKANVLVTVEGFDGDLVFDLGAVGTYYPVLKDVPLINTEFVSNCVGNLFQDKSPLVVDITAGGKLFNQQWKNPQLFTALPTTLKEMQPILLKSQSSVLFAYDMGSLNYSREPDITFLSELQIMQEIADMVTENKHLATDGVPDIYSFSLAGIHLIQLQYGLNSVQASDGLRVLSSFIKKFTEKMVSLYDDDLMMEVVTLTSNDPRMLRVKRDDPTPAPTKAPSSEVTPSTINVAPSYSDDYASMAHIAIWVSVFWIIAVYVIAYLMWFMDPGDTIIYRMTSTRIKTE
ncbi:renin receptor-like [Saccoglossus kowalevskii]|uniref:Renin receptor-like n=1 Tax=Saccoglossus kowalevskii TaxID=10224 RepID=A0ABM0GYI1_SACKO|nr:PREDICTED: renin receptor-like [Saccoglossus kowalevskii]